MSTILTPMQVEQRMIDLSRQLDAAQPALDEASLACDKAKIAWDVNSAKVRIAIRAKAADAGRRITKDEVDDEAMVRCQDEYMAMIYSDGVKRAAMGNVKRIATQIDIARSLGTSVRASVAVS